MSQPPGSDAPFYHLSLGAQLVVWATRKRLHLLRNGDDDSDVTTAFLVARLEGLLPALMSVVDVLLCGASNMIHLHAVACPCLAPHEVGLVNTIAHLQSGDEAEARCSLDPLLCAAAQRLVMPCMRAIAQGLAANGMHVNAIVSPRLAAASTTQTTAESGGPVIH